MSFKDGVTMSFKLGVRISLKGRDTMSLRMG